MKNKHRKSRLCLLLCLVLLGMLLSGFPSAARGSSTFAGTRQVILQADYSDLNNFVVGGRTTFELLLRKQAPQWLSHQLKANDRDLELTLSFEFSDFSEYEARLETLLGGSPAVLFDDSDGLFLMEGCCASSFLNFADEILRAADAIHEFSLSELWTTQRNAIELNGTTYEANSPWFSVYPDGQSPIQLRWMEIETTVDENNRLTRSIQADINSETSARNAGKRLLSRFNAVGEAEANDPDLPTSCTVTFSAGSMSELTEKTMQCLYVAASIQETQHAAENDFVEVTLTEQLNLAELMEEDASCQNLWTFPAQYSGFSSNDEDISVGEQQIRYRTARATFSFFRPFMVSSVRIVTDLSSLLPKIQRRILLLVPLQLAQTFHETIKSQLEHRLINGTTLNIYDENGMRCYEMVFASWFRSDIDTFTSAMLRCDAHTELEGSAWIPFGRQTWLESFDCSKLLEGGAGCSDVKAEFVFGALARAADSGAGTLVRVTQDEKGNVSLSFRRLNLFISVLEVLAFVVLLVLVLLLIRKIKHHKKERAARKAAKAATRPQVPQQPAPGATARPQTPRQPVPATAARPQVPQQPAPGATARPQTPQQPAPGATARPQTPRQPAPAPTARPQTPQQAASATPAPKRATSYCPHCGQQIVATARFCPRCGKPIQGQSGAPRT